MNEKLVLTGSVVLFEENLSDLHKTIDSFLQMSFNKKLYLIDNTATRFYEYVFVNKDIEYIAVEKNIGFGSAHNKIMNKIKSLSKYHLILNPDVSFKDEVIPNLIIEFGIFGFLLSSFILYRIHQAIRGNSKNMTIFLFFIASLCLLGPVGHPYPWFFVGMAIRIKSLKKINEKT